MSAYTPQTQDMQWLLSAVLQAPEELTQLGAFAEVDADLMAQVLEEAGKFVGDVIAPLNRTGDEIGAQWKDGAVTMPPGFKDAYQAFWQAGWPALSAAAEDGGQGLPAVLEAMLYEMLSAANHAGPWRRVCCMGPMNVSSTTAVRPCAGAILKRLPPVSGWQPCV